MSPYLQGALYGVGTSAIWVSFNRTEKLLKAGAKERIAEIIYSGRFFEAVAHLPNVFVIVLDTLFTSKILSIRGFTRSFVFSLFAVSIFQLWWWLHIPHPSNVHFEENFIKFDFGDNSGSIRVPIINIVLFPLIYNMIADYCSLLLIRSALGAMQRFKSVLTNIFITLFVSIVILIFIYISLVFINYFIETYYSIMVFHDFGQESFWRVLHGNALEAWADVTNGLAMPFAVLGSNYSNYIGANIYSTLLPVLWTVIFLICCILCRLISEMAPLGRFLDKYFYLRSQPLKVMGWTLILAYSVFHAILATTLYIGRLLSA